MDGRMDGQTDRRTDGQTSRTTTIGIFFEKRKTTKKETLKNIREAKKQYFDRIFTAYKNDIKKTWKTINETLNRNKNGCAVLSRDLHNYVEIPNLKDIANAFNEYFLNIGKNLASEIDHLDNNTGY